MEKHTKRKIAAVTLGKMIGVLDNFMGSAVRKVCGVAYK